MTDYLGNLYTKVADYLWDGSTAIPQIDGIKNYAVKPNNYIRWDKATAEARYLRKEEIQAADMPEVELKITDVRPVNADSCQVENDVTFTVSVASGNWKITNATKLYSQIISLLSVLIHTGEVCGWNIGQPNACVVNAAVGSGRVGKDKEIRKNQPGFTFDVNFTIRYAVQVYPTG
jgi:hypothetical protein